MPLTPLATLSRATVGGALYVPESHVAEAARVAGALAKPNPEYMSWVRRNKRQGRAVGSPPPQTYTAAGPVWEGPWAGGWWLPRHAPIKVLDASAAMTMPAADALTLRVTPRPYQVEAVDALLWEGSGVVLAPCGAGKTTIGAAVMARLDTPALVLVHTLDLAAQWVERCRSQLGVEAGMVGGGEDQREARVVVATIQTLTTWRWSERWEFGSRFGLVILDEAHHAPARTFAEVMAALPARYRLGLTATPTRQDGLEDLLYWTCGPVVYRISQRDLEAGGYTLRPLVTWLPTGCRVDVPAEEWVALTQAIADDEARNALIVAQVAGRVQAGRTVLVLSDRVEHCATLARMLTEAGVQASELVGRMSKRARADVLDRLHRGELQAVTATSLADEGLDVSRLDVVVLATPSRNEGRVQQRVGRVLRPGEGKAQPEVVDLVDDFGAARACARKRHALYRRLGWKPGAIPAAGTVHGGVA